MRTVTEFENHLPEGPRRQFRGLDSPFAIQQYLDDLPYIAEARDRCPLDVMIDGQCHCLDGGLFAALALRRLGDPGLLVDLVPAKDRLGRNLDDDHVLAIYQRRGLWGAVAKSNYAWLRFREPVYRTLRELAMSYFEVYFSIEGLKVLRGYTRPLNIARFDELEYAWREPGAVLLFSALYRRKPISLIPSGTAAELHSVDKRCYESGSFGVNWDWVYRPPTKEASA